jgi:hypothetical protein
MLSSSHMGENNKRENVGTKKKIKIKQTSKSKK